MSNSADATTNLVEFDAPPPEYPAAFPHDASTSTVEDHISALTHELDNFSTSISEELAQTHHRLMTTPDDPFASASRSNLTAKVGDVDRILREQINRLLANKDVRASQSLTRKAKALSERHRGLLGAWEEEEKRWTTHVESRESSKSGDLSQLDPIDTVPQLVDESGPFLDATNSRALSIGMEESGTDVLPGRRTFFDRHKKAIWTASALLVILGVPGIVVPNVVGNSNA